MLVVPAFNAGSFEKISVLGLYTKTQKIRKTHHRIQLVPSTLPLKTQIYSLLGGIATAHNRYAYGCRA